MFVLFEERQKNDMVYLKMNDLTTSSFSGKIHVQSFPALNPFFASNNFAL